MRFDAIKVRDVGPFKQVDLDLNALAGKLTAVTGANGAGKTTLLELLAGGLYRSCPTRGTLASLATSRAGSVEVRVTNGKPWTVRQTIDAVSGKGETLVLNADGEPVLESAKVSAGDAWVDQHLPAAETLYASSFAVQGKRGFLDLSRAERKALLIELLGLKRYEALAAEASTLAGATRASLAIHRARLAALPEVDLEALCAEALACQGRAATATEAVELARRSLERARAAAGDAERARELVEQRAGVVRRLEVAVGQIADTQERIKNNRALLDREKEIRDAASRTRDLKAELATVEREMIEARGEIARHDAAVEGLRKTASQAADAMRAAERRVRAVELRLADRDRVNQAAAKAEELVTFAGELEIKAKKAAAEIERLQHVLIAGKDVRIEALRNGLATIAEVPEPDIAPLNVWARNTLANDDGRAIEAERAPADLRAAREQSALAADDLKRANAALADARALMARKPEIEAAERDLVEAKAELEQADDAAREAVRALEAARKPCPAVAHLIALRDREVAITGQLAELKANADLEPRLDQAATLLEERQRQLAQQIEAKEAIERELAALPVVEALQVDVGQYERDLKAKELAERESLAAVTRAQDGAKLGEEVLAKRKLVQEQITDAETQLADYTRLAQDFGRDGLQLMEIDAALPELAALTNRLLHECFGPRFTVEIRTERASADGKRTIDGLDVVVLDTVNGREAQAETYSGGEIVLIGSALSLALTTLACRRSESEAPTLVLDEAGAALDVENGRAWIRMLRLAVEQIGASRCLFISHSPELQELADSRIVVANGEAVVA